VADQTPLAGSRAAAADTAEHDAPLPSGQHRAAAEPPNAIAPKDASRPPGGACVPVKGRFRLAFTSADIGEVIQQASRWDCRNVAYAPSVTKGTITLVSNTLVTVDEAYAALMAALRDNDITTYRNGKYYQFIRMEEAKRSPIPTYVDDGVPTPAVDQPITRVVRLQHADADALRKVLANYVSAQGDIQSVGPDLLIVTDTGLNVRRVERIIRAVDRPGRDDLPPEDATFARGRRR
jgi:general secretion pathway protein D